jgi:rhodanese-related sulfurtransferase
MKRLSAVLISLLIFATAYSQTPDSLKYQSLEPYDFHLKYLREDSAILIDVRETEEIKKIIQGAIIIPSKGNLDLAADTIGKEKSLFIYCNHGNRSRRVAIFFYDKGFRKLYSLEGGILAWRNDGFKVVRGPGKKRR